MTPDPSQLPTPPNAPQHAAPPSAPSAPAVDPTAPAAGGWVPTPGQRAAGVGVVSTFGMIAISLPATFPGSKAALLAGCICAAVAFGVGAVLGMNSAGPRKGV